MVAICQMDTKIFNQYLSTERFLMKIYNEFEEKSHFDLKYKSHAVRYFIDQVLLKVISSQRTSSTKIQTLGDSEDDYFLKYVTGYTSKDLNKWMLDILKKQFSTKLIFDDSYFLANLIKSCGNLLNMKNLNETVHEIIRQCRVDISRSKNIISKVNGSHNNLILLS